MINRYSLPEMKAIWEEENRYRKWLEIEKAICEAMAKLKKIPKSAVLKIRTRTRINLNRIHTLDKITNHEVIAFIRSLQEQVGKDGKYIHLGLTSSDVMDSGLSLQIKESGKIILRDIQELLQTLRAKSRKYKHTVMMGRTHNVHAQPITFGLKLAVWYMEMQRNFQRMKDAVDEISYGKISGAVGTYAEVEPFVEKYVCKKLGLKPAPISNQILQRDRHAQFLTTLAIIATSLDKFCQEIRNLQHTEILEVEEYFSPTQKGSSAMPHKRNPIIAERISGLSRVIRGNAMASLENIPLWHERDISHSSAERVIIPDSCILIDYILQKFTHLIENLNVYPKNMLENLKKSRNLIFSQRVLVNLIEKGMDSRIAYDLVQKNALKAWNNKTDFKEEVKQDSRIKKYLSGLDIENIFNIGYFLKYVDTIFRGLHI
ncbi:adenylosuccinate lyase [Candidatus Desantisbacteria bacterium CG1_02_38_46]|uniref:Adenylosuccinate lyase n=3 Tax=unclassified Candidatus Desantisiibacteriota TaxID=3106372 RepID=A0A2H9PBG5_9BACT|nr:MAG: adenylosuccinate lyase [Candidatus Desantisbacteria bacterium CG1_02_38_46]PIU51857.1 MAG: adenylosuccinate lyase [Candidatus Desantisbacteria bacterium CG07_land_8_20_14_0_80_39_15]PIZ16112.1 MAG: adenylosuccinate lyase [Candidatus Desantisbacteria bacterium CG_4_10_14_0_8_um_filter_39_17]